MTDRETDAPAYSQETDAPADSQVLDADEFDVDDGDSFFATRECGSCGDIIDECSQVCGFCARSWSMKA